MVICFGDKTQKNLLAFMGYDIGFVFGGEGCFIVVRIVTYLIFIFALVLFSYFLGRSHAKTKVITEQIEVIKYVEKKKSKIYGSPNIGRNNLLELMRKNQL